MRYFRENSKRRRCVFAFVPGCFRRFSFDSRVGIDVVVDEQIVRGYADDSEEIDGFEGNADHKKSDFDLDEDDAAPSSSSSSSNRAYETDLRVSIES